MLDRLDEYSLILVMQNLKLDEVLSVSCTCKAARLAYQRGEEALFRHLLATHFGVRHPPSSGCKRLFQNLHQTPARYQWKAPRCPSNLPPSTSQAAHAAHPNGRSCVIYGGNRERMSRIAADADLASEVVVFTAAYKTVATASATTTNTDEGARSAPLTSKPLARSSSTKDMQVDPPGTSASAMAPKAPTTNDSGADKVDHLSVHTLRPKGKHPLAIGRYGHTFTYLPELHASCHRRASTQPPPAAAAAIAGNAAKRARQNESFQSASPASSSSWCSGDDESGDQCEAPSPTTPATDTEEAMDTTTPGSLDEELPDWFCEDAGAAAFVSLYGWTNQREEDIGAAHTKLCWPLVLLLSGDLRRAEWWAPTMLRTPLRSLSSHNFSEKVRCRERRFSYAGEDRDWNYRMHSLQDVVQTSDTNRMTIARARLLRGAPRGRAFHTATHIGDGQILIFGGLGSSGARDDTWVLHTRRAASSSGSGVHQKIARTKQMWDWVPLQFSNDQSPKARAGHCAALFNIDDTSCCVLFVSGAHRSSYGDQMMHTAQALYIQRPSASSLLRPISSAACADKSEGLEEYVYCWGPEVDSSSIPPVRCAASACVGEKMYMWGGFNDKHGFNRHVTVLHLAMPELKETMSASRVGKHTTGPVDDCSAGTRRGARSSPAEGWFADFDEDSAMDTTGLSTNVVHNTDCVIDFDMSISAKRLHSHPGQDHPSVPCEREGACMISLDGGSAGILMVGGACFTDEDEVGLELGRPRILETLL